MFNNQSNNPQLLSWEIAYAARELRHNKTLTLSCLKDNTQELLKQLGSFSHSSPIMTKTSNKPNSNEVLLQIIETC